jgi:CoA:oxalate CoA-transferase
MGTILDDIMVLDLTHVWFGPWCTMMLADLGAEVIRIEPPWGAIDRIAEGALFGGASYTFHHLNLNKKDLTLNLKDPQGVEIFKELVKKGDVVVQNFSPGTMERLGLGYDVLRELNLGIIYAALSGFGQYGPYKSRRSYAMNAEAMSGHTRLTGDRVDPEGPPLEMAQAYGDLGPGTMAAMSIIAAIRYRDKTGVGQMIDVAQYDCMVAYNTAITAYTLSGLRLHELREKYPTGRGVGGLLKTKDNGWIRLSAFGPRALDRITQYLHVELDEVTKEMIEEKASEMTRDEAVDFFIEMGLPCSPVFNVDETVADPHLAARGMFIELEHPRAGTVKVPNFPVKLSETPGVVRTAAPLLGEHSKEVLMDLLGYSEGKVTELVKAGVTSLP